MYYFRERIYGNIIMEEASEDARVFKNQNGDELYARIGETIAICNNSSKDPWIFIGQILDFDSEQSTIKVENYGNVSTDDILLIAVV